MKIRNLLQSKIIRYFCVASVLVGLEILAFVLLNTAFHIYYIAATLVSNSFIIVLNWYFSRRFVFKTHSYAPLKELILVSLGSVIGILIQLAVIYISVTYFNTIPVLGKCLAIAVTFFWNFWFRNIFVFPDSK